MNPIICFFVGAGALVVVLLAIFMLGVFSLAIIDVMDGQKFKLNYKPSAFFAGILFAALLGILIGLSTTIGEGVCHMYMRYHG